MANVVKITLQVRDARPILWQAARDAAYYGSLTDYITLRTWNAPGARKPIADLKVDWRRKFLAAKRVVNSFGVDYFAVSEEDTVNPKGHVPYVGGRVKKLRLGSLGTIGMREGARPDPKKAEPQYKGAHHLQACDAAADKTVEFWLSTMNDQTGEESNHACAS